MYEQIVIPTGLPGMRETHYRKMLSELVRKKYQTSEQKEEWFTKFTAARRLKLIRLWHSQQGKCIFCQCDTWLIENTNNQSKRQMATLDHVCPQSSGGTDHLSNLAMSCHGCNSVRGSMDFHAFGKLRNDPVRWAKLQKDRGSKLRKLAKFVGRRTGEIQTSRDSKRAAKRQEFIWGLTLLWLFYPEYRETMTTTQYHFKKRTNQLKEILQKQLDDYPIDMSHIGNFKAD